MMEKTCSCNRTFVNECHVASQKIGNCRISLSALQRKKPHQLIQTYIIICTSPILLCRKPFSIFAAATSAFPAARPARRHHVSVHRSALPPCIPESRKGLVNNGAISRHDCGGAAPMRRVSGGRLRNFAAGGSCRTFIHPPPDSELFATSFMCQSL